MKKEKKHLNALKEYQNIIKETYENIKKGKLYGALPFSTDIVPGNGDSDQGEEDQSGDSTTNQNDNDIRKESN